ncbi:MAG: DUF427 domain-containing protein [Chloroflexota bacterium]
MSASRRIEPGPGQESVWDYPRPPRVEPSQRRVRIVFNGKTIVDSMRALRVLETSGPPVYYVPPEDVALDTLIPADHRTWCEWKGMADHYTLRVDGRESLRAAWSYPTTTPGYEALTGYFAFYPGRVDECLLDDEPVQPQPGDYYGGWITRDIVGPFKGGPGTDWW